MTVVPDEIVEAFVRVDVASPDWFGDMYGSYEDWKAGNPKAFDYRMAEARELLAAVYPLIRVAVAEEAAQAIEARAAKHAHGFSQEYLNAYADGADDAATAAREVGKRQP